MDNARKARSVRQEKSASRTRPEKVRIPKKPKKIAPPRSESSRGKKTEKMNPEVVGMYLPVVRCCKCRKEFELLSPKWAFRDTKGGRKRYGCSWKCWNARDGK